MDRLYGGTINPEHPCQEKKKQNKTYMYLSKQTIHDWEATHLDTPVRSTLCENWVGSAAPSQTRKGDPYRSLRRPKTRITVMQ